MAHRYQPAPVGSLARVRVWSNSGGTTPAVLTTLSGQPLRSNDPHTAQPVDGLLIADDHGGLPEFLSASNPVYVGATGSAVRLDPVGESDGSEVSALQVYGTPGDGKVPAWNTTTKRLEWATPSAASGPVVGRLKLADNTTFYGVPFTVADGLAWSSWPVDTLSSSLTPGNVRYSVPVLWQDPVTVTEIVLIGDSPAHDADFTPIDSEVHVAFVPVDENWQPIGAPLWQDVIAVPSTISSGDELSWPGLSLAVPAGRYMWAIEIDYANPDTALQGVFLQSQSTSGLGTGICVADGGSMAVGLSVPHVYGTFVTAPTPTAAIPGVPSNDGTGVPAGKPANFVLCHWDPA